MKQLATLLIDDEYLALDILQNFVERIPELRLVAKVKSAVEAIEIVNDHKIDLLFLDIQMPFISGIDFLKNLEKPPLTIFTTAYADYAYEAFELDVVDYLLKPISFERFCKAVEKAKQLSLTKYNVLKNEQSLVVKHNGVTTKIPFGKIIYVEALKEYVKIVCEDHKYVIFDRLKNIEQSLTPPLFIRVHRSYIVAKSRITAIDGNNLTVTQQQIPISRGKKDEITSWFNNQAPQ